MENSGNSPSSDQQTPTWTQFGHDAPTLAPTPLGQQRFGPMVANARQQGQTVWGRFRGLSRTWQVLIASGAVLVILVCSCCSCTAFASALNPSTAQSTATSSSSNAGAQAHTGNATATTARQQATPTAQAKATIAPTATPKPKPQPTSTPKPACPYPAVNGNPWCYTFTNTGKLIYSPPGNFCSYFNCIASFWNGSGYVMECQDFTYSKSGGRTGSCSRHGGDLRPLYQP